MRDYKFFCFNGEPLVFKIDLDRFTNHRANYYNCKTNEQLPFGEVICPPIYDEIIDFPIKLDEMKELAKIISKDFSFLRVDFYEVNGKVYFGETTFYPASGFGKFTDDEWDKIMGDWIEL